MKTAREIANLLPQAFAYPRGTIGLSRLAAQMCETAKSELLSPEESAAFYRCAGLAEEMAERIAKAQILRAERAGREQERVEAIHAVLRGKELSALTPEQRIAFIHRSSPLLITSLVINELVIEHVIGEVFENSLRDAAETLAARADTVSPVEAGRTFISETLEQMPSLIRAASRSLDHVRAFSGSIPNLSGKAANGPTANRDSVLQ